MWDEVIRAGSLRTLFVKPIEILTLVPTHSFNLGIRGESVGKG